MRKVIFLISIILTGLTSCQSQSTGTPATGSSWFARITGNATAGYQNINVAEFKGKMAAPDIVVLDVRTPEETAKGMIEGAIQIDFRSPDFETEIEKLDRDKTYLIYCRTGVRSEKACRMMAEKGFGSLYNMTGGYVDWTKQ